MMLGGGKSQGLRSHFTIGVEDVAAFIDAPAKIVALADEIDLLPQILPVIADPDMARFWIDGDPPRIAQAIGPGFGSSAFDADERIVVWDAVLTAVGQMIEVDSQDFGG